ncbi:hypothetical protein CVT26_012133 [Gymnopilus dilepis]|uniref:Uncharacterized protein n=1 Tax=Gymnopilus dilepis TaxID=231916 RepID=A0A409YGS9_9AGAR|nr:hypothetical protein CVT26_012133 [Gymnopilus dilepis]
MKVRVGWEDRPQNVQEEEGKEKLGTEVYLPLVHYAHERLVDGSWEREEREKARAREKQLRDTPSAAPPLLPAAAPADAEADGEADTASGSGGSSTVAGSIHEDHDNEQDQMPPSMTASISIDKPQSPFGFGTFDPAPLLIRDTTPDLIDVEVKVSGGTYEVRGQGLVWWYDVPPPPASSSSSSSFPPSRSNAWSSAVDVSSTSASVSRPSKKPQGEKWEYTIEVKRRGGALPSPNKPKPKPKPKVKSASDSSNSKSGDKEYRGRSGGSRSTRGKGGRQEQSWLERICCPEDGGLFGLGCVVA